MSLLTSRDLFFSHDGRSEVAKSVVFYYILVNSGLPLTAKTPEPLENGFETFD